MRSLVLRVCWERMSIRSSIVWSTTRSALAGILGDNEIHSLPYLLEDKVHLVYYHMPMALAVQRQHILSAQSVLVEGRGEERKEGGSGDSQPLCLCTCREASESRDCAETAPTCGGKDMRVRAAQAQDVHTTLTGVGTHVCVWG